MRQRSLRGLLHSLSFLGRSIALVGTFAGALVYGVSIHSRTPAFRRVATTIGNEILGGLFEGKIILGEVQSLSIGRSGSVRVSHVEVLDPQNQRVIGADDIEGTIDLEKLIRAVANGEAPWVDLAEAKVANVDVVLDVDEQGVPKIAKTFEAKKKPSTDPKKPVVNAGPPKDPTLHIPKALVGHAHVHGNITGKDTPLDAFADAIEAKVNVEHDVAKIELVKGKVTLLSPNAGPKVQKAPIVGVGTGNLEVQLATTTLKGSASFDGSWGDIPVKAHAEIDKEEMDATVDIARVSPEAVAKSFADVPLKEPVEVHAHAHKKGPTVRIEANAKLGAATVVVANGEIDTREGKAFKLDADATHVDARAFGANVQTDLTAKIHGEGTLEPVITTTFRVTTSEGGIVAAEPVPAVALEGRFEGKKVIATFQAKDPGVDARGKVELDVQTKIATFDVQARSNSLRAVPRAGNVIGGSATARVQGKIDIEAKTIRATANATVDGLALDALTAKHADANGVISGPLDAPVLDAHFTSTELKLTANGKEPLEYPEAKGRARISFVPTPRVLDASVEVSSAAGKDNAITASAQGIHVANGSVEARGLRVTGLGEPLELDVSMGGQGQWRVRAKSGAIDLGRAATMTGIKELKNFPPGARASVDVDVRQEPGGADGHIDVVVTTPAGGVFPVAVVAEAHAKIDHGKLVGNAKVAADDMGQIEIIRAEIDVPSRLDAKSLQRTTGVLDLRGAFNLQTLALFAGDKVEHVSGIGRFEGRIERRDPDTLPMARGTIRTEGLEVALNLDEKSEAFLISGVDLSSHVSWDGRTDDAEVAVLLWDERGRLANVNGKSKVPLVKWITGAQKVDADTIGALELIAVADVPQRDLREMPEFMRPPGIRGKTDAQLSIEGTFAHPRVALSAGARGLDEDREGKEKEKQRALEKDRAKEREKWAAAAKDGKKRPPPGMGMGMPGMPAAQQPPPSFEPLDGTLQARWDGERAVVTFSLDEREKRRGGPGGGGRPGNPGPAAGPPNAPPLALPRREGQGGRPPPQHGRPPQVAKTPGHLRGLVIMTDTKMTDVLHGRPLKELPWRASAEVEIENLALAALGLPLDVSGSLTGRARIKELNHDPSFEGNAHIENFGAGGTKVAKVDITAGGRDKSLFAHAVIEDQPVGGTEPTKATFQLAAQSPRVERLKFDWDKQALLRLDYAIQNGRLALLGPIVKRWVPEIEGRVDGAGSVTIEGKSQAFEGGLAVHEGRVYANAIGEEISNLTAIARFDRTGTWRIDDASGKLGSGTFRASASGHLKGFDLTDAEATVVASNGVPISSQSATFAEASGELKITLKKPDEASPWLVTADVPRAQIELPDRSTQQLESLDPDAAIAVGVRSPKGVLDTTVISKSRGGTGKQSTGKTTTTAKTTPSSTRITATLGNQVRLEGRGIDVQLTGKTVIDLAEEVRVTGRIDLRGGTIEVHGRRFNVDSGVVTFAEGGDPSDPTIVAAAYWDAPDRTRVWVEFVGPLKSGKLTLRSEPPYSKNEILSVLLFGRPDPNMAAAGGTTGQKTGDASGATAVGSGFVAGDLNRVLSEIDENLDIETDTLSGNRTRTKLGRSFFDRRLKVQIGYAPGKTYREPDTTYIFLNWQFIPKWSIVATRGDRGTSILDVLFQHRY